VSPDNGDGNLSGAPECLNPSGQGRLTQRNAFSMPPRPLVLSSVHSRPQKAMASTSTAFPLQRNQNGSFPMSISNSGWRLVVLQPACLNVAPKLNLPPTPCSPQSAGLSKRPGRLAPRCPPRLPESSACFPVESAPGGRRCPSPPATAPPASAPP